MVHLEKVTRALCLAVACLCVPWSLSLFGQQVTPDTYTPLPTLFQLLQKDPTFGGANLYYLAADKANFRATLEKQAASGNLVAQMMLGEAYIPPECTFLPYKTAPADCPQDPPNNSLGLTRSFDVAIQWLTLASEQGNGEASEILAQLIERVIKSPTPSHYQMADVAHYHALARSQGYDLQDVEYFCYTLDPSHPADRLAMAKTSTKYEFTQQELDALHAAGAAGTLTWRVLSAPSITTLLRHPEGPKFRTRVILGRPPSKQILVPMADRIDVVYLQQGDHVVTIPSTYPAIRRKISFRPPTAEEGAGAGIQAIDGSFSHGCASPALP
jgi:hypothetical protein